MRTIFFLILLLFPLTCFSSERKLEAFIKQAVESANRSFIENPARDGVTVSQTAYAQNKGVVYELTLAIKQNVDEDLIRMWRASVRSEIYPEACIVIRKTPYYDAGFNFRYRYFDTTGRLLDDFIVNKSTCDGMY